MQRRRKRRALEINIIPLIDVLVVLIFFFLMTMEFRQIETLGVAPPKIESAQVEGRNYPVVVEVDANGLFALDGKVLEKELLKGSLLAAIQKSGQSKLLVLADSEAPLGNVTFVMDIARSAGVQKINLQSR